MKRILSILLLFCVLFGVHELQAGKSYSSGSRSSGRSFSSGSSKSFSSGSRSSSSSSRSYSSKPSTSSSKPSSSPSPSYKPSSSGGSWFSGGSSTKPTPTPSASSKPSGNSFGSSMSSAVSQQNSKNKYVASQPKSQYKTPGPSGTSKPIDPNSSSVKNVRNIVTHERYVTYDNRAGGFYGSWYHTPYYYNDCFSPFLMGWMLSDAISSSHRAEWMYHHRSEIDDKRYNDLLAKDTKLQAELDQLKAKNIPVDPNYAPPEMSGNTDLMYSKEYIDAAANPQLVPNENYVEPQSSYMWLLIVVVFGIAAVFIYYLFVKEY